MKTKFKATLLLLVLLFVVTSCGNSVTNENFDIWCVAITQDGIKAEHQLDISKSNAAVELERILRPLFPRTNCSFEMYAESVESKTSKSGNQETSVGISHQISRGPYTPIVRPGTPPTYCLLDTAGEPSGPTLFTKVSDLCKHIVATCRLAAKETADVINN